MKGLMKTANEVPDGFLWPTVLPANSSQEQLWQDANRSWWENHPMRYDWKEVIQAEEFSKEFFTEIDRRFFSLAALYAPWKETPFDGLIDFDSLAPKRVLEIGVGNGSHAQLLATYAGSFTGIVSRFLTNTCGWGSFLVSRLVKREGR